MAPLKPSSDVRSLWQDTAAKKPEFAAFSGTRHYDVAIIGGGYTGLTTARYLAAKGLSPVVLEANRIGWGASGRNGGVISGKFRVAFADIAERFGLETARHMHDFGLEAIEHVGELVESYGIDAADYQQTGSLRCAHNAVTLAALKKDVDWLNSALGDTSCMLLGRDETVSETGSADFIGSMLNTHGGIIHPLNFALGIAAGLQRDGIEIFENAPVQRLRRDEGGVLLELPDGIVQAQQAVIATNAYSDITSATESVRKSIIPFRSAMIATQPLSGTPGAKLLPKGRSYSETRRMMRWFRKSGDRLLYGGRGAFGKTDSETAFAALHKAMIRQFPTLLDIKITHKWSGLVAMTMDSIPHLGRLDNRIVFAVGYNGAGVALSSYMGKHVADLITGGSPNLGLVTAEALKPVPFYPIREPAVRLVAGWYQFLDAIGQ
ncbi:MAG: FAD-dependent oxidoreductase [Alphaproteobacteria bacterium]|nr:FAD-dependent oxidoreductase [Alphaproteobacteria bacterium]